MAYQIAANQIGYPALSNVSTSQGAALGAVVDIVNKTAAVPLGGEAIYLKASGASIVAGSLVDYDPYLNTATLSPATTGVGPVAVSLNVVASGSYAWFQITGAAAVKAPNAMSAGADVFMLAATPGSVDDAAVNGEQILNAKVSTTTGTPSSGLAYLNINRPFHQGQVV